MANVEASMSIARIQGVNNISIHNSIRPQKNLIHTFISDDNRNKTVRNGAVMHIINFHFCLVLSEEMREKLEIM